MPLDEALALGAMAFFSEKYGDEVRVVTMGPSIELCGGTHVRTTGQLGLFRFSGQGGVASGVRRIEAITGPEAYAEIGRLAQELEAIAGTLKARPEHIRKRIEQLLEERERLERRVAEMAASGAAGPMAEAERLQVDGVTVVLGDTSSEDKTEIGTVADRFREGNAKGVLLLFSSAGRGAIHAAVTDDLVKAGKRAGDLVNLVAEVSGGKGGGRPVFASAGAGDVTRLGEARSAAPAIVERWLRDGA
jgi:alanyl-tRNA synthetase